MNIAVIGTGTMGTSLAQVFSMCNEVNLVHICKGHELSKNDGITAISNGFERMIKKNKIESDVADRCIKKIKSCSLSEIAEDDFIIEAVKEDLTAKNELFLILDKICKPECIFTTNTSSIAINQIEKNVNRPVYGMHFFNPATVMELVEIIEGEKSEKKHIDWIMEFAKKIHKTPVLIKEAPGYVVNRILIPMINEAIGIYAEGVASKEDIDKAMCLGANHPMGPLALGDLIGLDVILAILEVMLKETGDPKYKPESLLKKMVRDNKLGRKTGEGFYVY